MGARHTVPGEYGKRVLTPLSVSYVHVWTSMPWFGSTACRAGSGHAACRRMACGRSSLRRQP